MPVHLTMEVTGTEDVLEFFDKELPRALMDALSVVIEAEATFVMERAQELVPTDMYNLRDSGRVEEFFRGIVSPLIGVDVVFGDMNVRGEDVYYAWIVHEDVADFHDDGQAKYLETAGLEAEGSGLMRVSEGLRRVLR